MQGDYSAFTTQRTFIGVVEDRNDPLQLGRVKVRAYSVPVSYTHLTLPTSG